MQRKYTRSLVFFFLFALLSCNPEEDTTDPMIEYLEPAENTVVNLPDTLEVKVKVTDDKQLTQVILNLLNTDKIPVGEPHYYYPVSHEFEIETFLILEDKALTSGTYELQVFASDGQNNKFKYRDIVIKEIPRTLISYLAVTSPLSFKSNLIRLTPDFEIDSQMVIEETHNLSCVHSLWEKFFFVTDEPSVITAYDPLSFEFEWSVSVTPPRALVTDIMTDKDLLFSTANGNISVMAEWGAINLQTMPYADKTITCMAADERFIYAAHQSLSGDIHQLSVYYRVTGALMDQPQLSAPIADIVPLESTLLVFLKTGNDLGIMEYNPADFTLTSIAILENETLKSVEKISDARMLLVTNRCVILYNYSNHYFSDFTDQPYDFCRYDDLIDVVFLAKENRVTGFGLESGNMVEEIDFQDEVVDFQILYNK